MKLPTVLLFVEFNTTMALAILPEQCDFDGAGVGQSCGCETAPGDQQWNYGLLVWRCVVQQTRHKIPKDRNWKRTRYGAAAIRIDSLAGMRGLCSARRKGTLNTDVTYRTALCIVNRNRSVVALTVSCCFFLMYLPWKCRTYFRCCRLSCTRYISSIFSYTPSTPSHFLKCCLLNLHLQYASVQAGFIFQAINWLLFFYTLEQKRPLWVVW